MTIATAIQIGPATYAGADALAESSEGVFIGTGAIGLSPGVRGAEGESNPNAPSASGLPMPGNFQASWNSAIESLAAAVHESAPAGGDTETRAQSVDPGLQRTVEPGSISGVATKRDIQECAAGQMTGEFAMPGESTHDTTAGAHHPDHAMNHKLVDGRHRYVDSYQESGIANPVRKPATEAQPIAAAAFSMPPSPVGPAPGNDSECERPAPSPSAIATGALPETRTRESASLPPPSRTSVFVGADAGVSTAEESATRMAANDEFVPAASRAGTDQGASKAIDSRCALGSEENQAIPTGDGVLPADFPRGVPPVAPGLSHAPVMQPAQWPGHGAAAPKDPSGQLINSRTTRRTARADASAGFTSEKASLSIAGQEGMSPVQLRNAVAGNGSSEQSAASAAGLVRGAVNEISERVVEDPFAAIDTDRSLGATTWMHAGLRHAEAGYLDPSLGWVGVRADVSGSGIHAAVVPGSAEAAQALSGHISGLSAYMAEHHGQTATVTLASPQHSGDGTGTGPQAGFGGASAERHSTGSDREGPRSAGAVEPSRERSVSSAEPIPGTITIGQQGSARAGTYVSVLA